MKDYSRPVRLTASGYAYNGPCRISGITVSSTSKLDTVIHLRDGATGQRIFTADGDSSSSAYSKGFSPPMRFFHGCYVEFDSSDSGSVVSVEVIAK